MHVDDDEYIVGSSISTWSLSIVISYIERFNFLFFLLKFWFLPIAMDDAEWAERKSTVISFMIYKFIWLIFYINFIGLILTGPHLESKLND